MIRKIFALLVLFAGLTACNKTTEERSNWIGDGSDDPDIYKCLLFRKEFIMDKEIPGSLPVQISAKQRYRLFVNGIFTGSGPQISDPGHWKYDEYDITPGLREGKNVIAVEVYSFGSNSPRAFFPSVPILWFRSYEFAGLNSDEGWLVRSNQDIFPVEVINGIDVRGGFIAGCSDSVIYKPEIKGWNKTGYDDSSWKRAVVMKREKYSVDPGPRTIDFMETRKMTVGTAIAGKESVRDFVSRDIRTSFRVEAGKKIKILFDHGTLTTGYPVLRFSGGEGSKVKLAYAESLYWPDQKYQNGEDIPEKQGKGNRNETEGKEFVGYRDIIIPDGLEDNIFVPSWYRTFRFLEVTIETGEEDIIIEDLHHRFTAYPFRQQAYFQCNDSTFTRIWETGWRTARLCAWETYMDCPYYEQLQYIGDTRIQSLISLYQTADPVLMRNAIELFSYGTDPETGLIPAAYPSSGSSFIPPFSLFWTLMVVDYWMHVPDKDFAFSFTEKIKGIIDWHLLYLDKETGTIKGLPFWNFVDWPKEWAWDPKRHTGGIPDGAEGGLSSILNLQFVYSLQNLSSYFRASGESDYADKMDRIAAGILSGIKKMCWSDSRELLSDSPEKASWSQHANLLAVLTGLIDDENVLSFMKKIALDKDLIQTTIYYRFYLNRAMETAGCGGLYHHLLEPWTDMLDLGLTTFAEKNDPTRSDCHAWSASPCYDFLSLVCGIKPDAPGFEKILVCPEPGPLKWINAGMPHLQGMINFEYRLDEFISISLPGDLDGKLIFRNEEIALHPGENIISLKADKSPAKDGSR